MPTYEYQCDACRREFEVRQRISEDPLTVCDVCGGHVRRLLSPAPFILKGGGWYVTDYPSESRKKAMESDKSSDAKPAESKPSDSKPADSKSSDPKPSESKSEGSKSSESKTGSSAASPSTSASSSAPSSTSSG